MKQLNDGDKPRERLLSLGPESLSDAELLAIILRSGGTQSSALSLAQQLLRHFGGLPGLIKAGSAQLTNFKHVGIAKATGIMALSEITKRALIKSSVEKIVVEKPSDIYQAIKKDLYNKEKEYLFIISLDARNKIISKDLISIGTINETLISPREVFRQALLRNSTSIALAHNHPSGNSQPSREDIIITERMVKTGIEIGIPLLDHLIICNDSYTSLKSLGVLKKEVRQ